MLQGEKEHTWISVEVKTDKICNIRNHIKQ
jgi:hypothetical protein